MKPNKLQQPKIKTIDQIDFPQPEIITLPNGTQLFVMNHGEVDVCRIDFILEAGSRYQRKTLVASASASLLAEGTKNYNSQEISEYFDFWGSFIGSNTDKDFIRITAYSLTKHLSQTLLRLEEVVKSPIYPEHELSNWAKRGKQALTIEMEKTSTPARIELFKSLYGLEHPYGMFANPDDYQMVQAEDIKRFHSEYFGSSNTRIFLAGKVGNEEVKLLEKYFGTPWGNHPFKETTVPPSNPKPGNYFISKPKAVQSSIRIGREICSRTDPDFTDLSVLNTILGGYFGSRLMMNLREDKGYTYGIGSHILSLENSTALVITVDVGSQYTRQAIDEIWKEIERLKTEPVLETELKRVRNHLMGEMLRNFNGPFAIADNTIGLACYNKMDYSLHERFIQSIKHLSSHRIIELANKWFNKKEMVQVIAGSQNPF